MEASNVNVYFLDAAHLLRYLMGYDDRISTLIMCPDSSVALSTTDYELYQAFGSLKDYDRATKARITKLLENVDVHSHKKETGTAKPVLTHERVEELRKIAIKNTGDDGK